MSAPTRSRPVRFRVVFACTALLALLYPWAAAQPGCDALDAPISPYLQQYAQETFRVMRWSMNVGTLRPTIPQPGWSYVGGHDWYFQIPPNWTLRDRSAVHAWVSDSRNLVHMIFVQSAQAEGGHGPESLYLLVLNETIAPRTSCSRVNTFASDSTFLFPGSNAGFTQAWVFRWLDPRAGTMIGTVQVMLQGQGIYTQYGYSFTSAPEAELQQIADTVFGPITFTFYATDFAGSTENDADGDGYGDSEDRYPADATRH